MSTDVAPSSQNGSDGNFRLNGWHVLAMLVTFFAIIFAANGVMMRYAISTFSGTESDTPYKDGLAYNTELEAARRQEALGWKVQAQVVRTSEGTVRVTVEGRAANAPLAGVGGNVRLERPTDKREDRSGELALVGSGRWQADLDDVAPGQWDLVVTLEKDGQRAFLSRNRVQLR